MENRHADAAPTGKRPPGEPMLSVDQMRRIAETAARIRAATGGDLVHTVTLVSEPTLVGEGLGSSRSVS